MTDAVIPPARSIEQRKIALRKANEIRLARAADKKRIDAGVSDPREIVLGPPRHWETAKIGELLMSIRGVGRTKVERMLRRIQVSPTRTLAGLTKDQRARIVLEIARYCRNDGPVHVQQNDRAPQAGTLVPPADESSDEPLI